MKKNTFPGKEYKLKIGSNVRKWRNLKSIKQKELASSLNLSEAAISNIDNVEIAHPGNQVILSVVKFQPCLRREIHTIG